MVRQFQVAPGIGKTCIRTWRCVKKGLREGDDAGGRFSACWCT